MNVEELGYVSQPEQFAKVDEDCILADSITARDFLRQRYGSEGLVFLGALYFAATYNDFLPVWLLVDVKVGKVVAATPVFKVDNFEFYNGINITKTKIIDHDTYFYWKNQLYASVFTSTGEIIVRKMRSILSAQDMFNIATLDENMEVERCYPVKLYDQNNGHFLTVCWEINSKDAYWYETVCADDDVLLSKIRACETVSFPISVGERAIIGGDYYMCCYDKALDLFFQKTPFKATEADRAKEDIPLMNVMPTPTRPNLKVIFSQKDEQKKEKTEISKIVALHPKK